MNRVLAIQDQEQSKENVKKMYVSVMKEFDDLRGIVCRNEMVLIKPNLVAPFEKATTDLTLLECLIKTILNRNAIPIIAESSGFEFSTADTFRILGVDKLCSKYGVKLLNLDDVEYQYIESGNPLVPRYKMPKILSVVDKIIDVPCLKGHSLTKVTFGIKNLFGLLHRDTRREIHATNLELGIAYLRKLVHVDFVMVDGLWNLINAVYSESFYQGIVVAGNSVDAVDRVCCSIFGVDYLEIPHIKLCARSVRYHYTPLSAIKEMDNHIKERQKHFIRQNYLYKSFYCFDRIFAGILKRSVIPYLHYWLGLRPYIDKKKCNNCGKCYSVCPTHAIRNKKILHKKCMNIRCFKCWEVCPNQAVIEKGLHK